MPGNSGPSSGQNNNTNSGTASRARSNSRGGRGNQSGASSRAASTDGGGRTQKDDIKKRYKAAVDKYKIAHKEMAHFERLDFMAAAIKLSETNAKISVLSHLTQFNKVESKYYNRVYQINPKFENTKFEFKEQTPKNMYKYYMDQAIKEMKRENVDYQAIMSKAVMMTLIINRYHSPEAKKNLSFTEFIKVHPTADKDSKTLQENIFPTFSNDKRPAGSRPTGHAHTTPHPPTSIPTVTTTIDTLKSSFDTQHFGEEVPEEYRV